MIPVNLSGLIAFAFETIKGIRPNTTNIFDMAARPSAIFYNEGVS
jgi:hypothetical protein